MPMTLADIRTSFRVVTAHIRYRPVRILLAMLSTIAAACVVVWVVSGYDSLIARFDEFSEHYLGRYELIVVPRSDGVPGETFGGRNLRLHEETLDRLRQDPSVAFVEPVLQSRGRIAKLRGDGDEPEPPEPPPTPPTAPATSAGRTDSSDSLVVRQPPMMPTMVGMTATEPPYRMLEGTWIDPRATDEPQAAVSSGVAERLKLQVGDQLTIAIMPGRPTIEFRVVGIVEQAKPLPTTPPIIGLPAMKGPPLQNGPAIHAVYVPMAFAEKLTGSSNVFDFAGIVLKKGEDVAGFRKRWLALSADATPKIDVLSLQEVESELDNSNTSNTVRSQAYSATGISLLAALFIIFSTLSMGVDERIRQFAVLRAVTFTRTQIATMILFESLILGLIGWAGGLLAGAGLLQLVVKARPDAFPVGAALGTRCVLLSGACSIGGAFAAAILPMWKATRVKPLDAMTPQVPHPPTRMPWLITLVGLICVMVNPLVVFWIPMPDTSRYLMSAAIGCTCMGIGFILLAPAVVNLTERLIAPVLARLLFLNPRLISNQLQTNLWRTLGATISLTLGLGLFISMQTWGYSMLGPFTPGDWVPDMLAVMTPTGIPESEIETVRHLPGVVAERSLPCVFEQVKFATDVTGARIRATSSRQDNCVLVGVDPVAGIGSDNPIFKFPFVRGNRQDATRKLAEGRYCLVPDHFERESHLSIGDKFGIIHPETKEVLEYEIAGVVSMTGWHWISKAGLRNHGSGRSAGLMFASFQQVKSDMGLERICGFWLNCQPDVTEDQVKAELGEVAEKNFDRKFIRRGGGGGFGPGFGGMPGPGGMPGRGIGRMPGSNSDPHKSTSVAIRSREGVRHDVRERADGIIWLLSRLPLVTLAVTALGVVNTVISSVRARQWDLGVMRAIGVTRWGLFRLVLSESILIGISACILSFGFGVMAGYCGTGVTRYVNVRGGQITPLVIPWQQINWGFLMTLGICLIAALWPAIRVGRTQPLKLLQAGRSAA